jgi:eukaryotic-like serine/threonine-protein kinase
MADFDSVRQIFLDAIRLPAADRLDYARHQSAGDPELFDQVATLLANHTDQTIFSPAVAKAPLWKRFFNQVWAKIGAFLEAGPWRRVLFFMASLVVVVALGIYIDRTVSAAIVALVHQQLESSVAASAEALGFWSETLVRTANGFAARPDVVDVTRRLSQMNEIKRNDVEASSLQLAAEFAALKRTEHFDSFLLIDRTGRVLIDDRNGSGHQLSNYWMAIMAEVLRGNPQVIAPETHRVSFLHPMEGLLLDRVWAVVPVTSVAASKPWGIVLLGRPANQEIKRLFASGAFGKTAEILAVNSQGLVLSESRFATSVPATPLELEAVSQGQPVLRKIEDRVGFLQLSSAELQREKPPRTAAFQLMESVRDSGQYRPRSVAGEYADYRNVRVLGAATWVPALNVGLIGKVDSEEAMAPLQPIRWQFGGVLGLLSAFGLWNFIRNACLERRTAALKERRCGAYLLGRLIGAGGMGEVFLARHDLLDRPTAVKILPPGRWSESMVKRFRREVLLASRLRHPNTIQVYDFGTSNKGALYFAMEFVSGYNLAEVVSLSGPLPTARVIFILKQVCASLAEAHQAGLVHRDIKPQNVMITDVGGALDFVKVLDFGLARTLADEGDTLSLMIGTPHYMAPERIISPGVGTTQSDIYSVGALAHFLITGRTIFSSREEWLQRAALQEMPTPDEYRDLPRPLANLLCDCIALEPAERPPSVWSIAEQLEKIQLISAPWSLADARQWWQNHGAAPLAGDELFISEKV